MITKLSHVTLFVNNQEKGVQFAGPPEERFYGIEAIMKDGQGNWFSMTQHTPQ